MQRAKLYIFFLLYPLFDAVHLLWICSSEKRMAAAHRRAVEQAEATLARMIQSAEGAVT